MVQPEERLTARISFYTKPSIDERLDKVVAASPWEKPGLVCGTGSKIRLCGWRPKSFWVMRNRTRMWRMRLLRCSSLRRWHRSRGWSRSMGY